VPEQPPRLQLIHRGDATLKGPWTGPIEPLLAWLAQSPVRDVTIAPPDLGDLFLAYYAGGQSPSAAAGQAEGPP
jgi:hypothetical protein